MRIKGGLLVLHTGCLASILDFSSVPNRYHRAQCITAQVAATTACWSSSCESIICMPGVKPHGDACTVLALVELLHTFCQELASQSLSLQLSGTQAVYSCNADGTDTCGLPQRLHQSITNTCKHIDLMTVNHQRAGGLTKRVKAAQQACVAAWQQIRTRSNIASAHSS